MHHCGTLIEDTKVDLAHEEAIGFLQTQYLENTAHLCVYPINRHLVNQRQPQLISTHNNGMPVQYG